MAYRWIRSVFCFAMMASFSSSLCHAVDVPMIWCFDTWGEPLVEAETVGADVAMDSVVTHPNYPIQVDSLLLPQAAGLGSTYKSNWFTVAGDDFIIGFWIRISTANMGAAANQDILQIFTEVGVDPDFTLNHTSGFPTAGDYDWTIKDANGVGRATVNQPFPEDTWKWVTLYYRRHDTTGQVVVFLHGNYPSQSKSIILTAFNHDFKSGSSSTMQIRWAGQASTPAGGMAIRIGGMYVMDGTSSGSYDTDLLDHQAFHSLRPEKDSVTPDVKWSGGSPGAGDNLNAGLWKNLGDRDRATFGRYAAGYGKGGAVQTEDYDFSTSVLDADVNVGKFVYDIGGKFTWNGRYVYGYYDVSANSYYVSSAAVPGSGDRRRFEHVIYAGDLRWTIMSNDPVHRAIPVLGFSNASFIQSIDCLETAFVKMWPKGAPGASELIELINRVPFGATYRAERIGG